MIPEQDDDFGLLLHPSGEGEESDEEEDENPTI